MAQATLPAPPAESTSAFWLLVSFVYTTIYVLQRVTFSVVYFATYTLPTWLFTVLGMSLTFTMNFTTLYTPGNTLRRCLWSSMKLGRNLC